MAGWLAALLLFLLPLVGLVSDGGYLFAQDRLLQQLADGAARRGAEQLDVNAYRLGGGIGLAVVAAEQAADDYVRQEDPGATGSVAADAAAVTVHLERRVPLHIFHLLHPDPVTIRATAAARVRMQAGGG